MIRRLRSKRTRSLFCPCVSGLWVTCVAFCQRSSQNHPPPSLPPFFGFSCHCHHYTSSPSTYTPDLVLFIFSLFFFFFFSGKTKTEWGYYFGRQKNLVGRKVRKEVYILAYYHGRHLSIIYLIHTPSSPSSSSCDGTGLESERGCCMYCTYITYLSTSQH